MAGPLSNLPPADEPLDRKSWAIDVSNARWIEAEAERLGRSESELVRHILTQAREAEEAVRAGGDRRRVAAS